jgi:hypothetical protein
MRSCLIARAFKPIQFVQKRQEDSHCNSNPSRVLICIHSCCHRTPSRKTFRDRVSWPRHKYTSDETSQVTKGSEKYIPPESLVAGLGYPRSQPSHDSANRHPSYCICKQEGDDDNGWRIKHYRDDNASTAINSYTETPLDPAYIGVLRLGGRPRWRTTSSLRTTRRVGEGMRAKEQMANCEKRFLQFSASLHRLLHGDFVGVFDIAADGNAGGDARHLHGR